LLDYDNTKRESTTTLDIFQDGNKPTKPYKEIAELTYVGFTDEEPDAKADIVKHAKKLGANGLIFVPPIRTGYQFNFGAKSGQGCNFKGIAVIYQ